MVEISSWGRLHNWEHEVASLVDRRYASAVIKDKKIGLAYGMGKSYGDVCLNPNGFLWNTTGLDRLISFDEKSGCLVCEAGVLVRDIQKIFVPRGWMLPVTPGTQLITVGGAIANDVHGKNHHVFGSFGDHVKHITLLRTNGETIECSPQLKEDWFAATVGGLGLTGFILTVKIQLRPVKGPWLDTESISYESLDGFFSLADESENDWEHTVSWIDCLHGGGRGIFMRGNHSPLNQQDTSKKNTLSMIVEPPVSLVNRMTLKPFNVAYFYKNKLKAGKSIKHYESFFYPLDNLLKWNRMYGPKGFYQYQSVIPREHGKEAVKEMLRVINKSKEGSFLAVLKTFGERKSIGMLSFPQPGVTLALDFPNRDGKTLKLFNTLNKIVSESGGRIYPAKDACMPKELFESGYPKLNEFLQYRDPGISSAMSRRLMGS